ncbi:hypothetical protein [Vulcanococcus limneticus]|uniref:hypothetical protein n=1 Tax=Vulcanococcus limneticus TaxID=2170428 RepID=UPI00398BE634
MTTEVDSIVITLDLTGKRIRDFHEINCHLSSSPPEVLPGRDGSTMTDSEILEEGLLTPEALAWGGCTPGTIGVAASMRWIWQEVGARSEGALVMEDDAQTHPQILDYIGSSKDELEKSDITFFGYNTDAPLSMQTPEGLELEMFSRPQYPSTEWIGNALSKTKIKDVRPYKYLKGFGMLCYWISPQGARRIEERCFPLTLETCHIPLLPHPMPGISIDRRLCAFYPELDARITWPPLAYSQNSDSSTR